MVDKFVSFACLQSSEECDDDSPEVLSQFGSEQEIFSENKGGIIFQDLRRDVLHNSLQQLKAPPVIDFRGY